MLLTVANPADFVEATRKFSNKMRFVVEPVCCIHCTILSWPSLFVYCAECTQHLSNICRSKSWGYTMKSYFRYFLLSAKTPWQLSSTFTHWIAKAEL